MAKRRNNKLFRYLEFKILHIDDSPHKIALGFAIGLFIAWTPLVGLHILLAMLLSMLFRANKFAAFVSIWVSNIFTFFIIYYPNYLFGKFVFNLFVPDQSLTDEQVIEGLRKVLASANMLEIFYSADYWRHFWSLSKSIGYQLWIGSIIIGALVAVCGYLGCYKIITMYRAQKPHRRYRQY